MFTISRKTKENISLTVSIACLLISALWLIFYVTFDPHTNLSDVSAFHFLMWFSSVLFGGLIGVCIVPAVTASVVPVASTVATARAVTSTATVRTVVSTAATVRAVPRAVSTAATVPLPLLRKEEHSNVNAQES